MGAACCGTQAPDAPRNGEIDLELKEHNAKAKAVKKLLLIGAGGSGKSTFFKQLKRIHTSGFKMQERLSYKSQIGEQIITQMQTLIDKIDILFNRDPEKYGDLKISSESQPIAKRVMRDLRAGMEVTSDVANMIEKLWEDPAIKMGYELRAKLCVFDSSNYFFDNVRRIAQSDYVPTEDDILFVRHRTTGMNQETFTIKGTKFLIVDVGGQRSERRKWIHFFEGVTGLVFVASLSCFNELLYEDENVNVMHETLQVFRETCNSVWFQSTSTILFLNKRDLFEEKVKVKRASIRVAFPDYDGPDDDVEASIKYIGDVFDSLDAAGEEREVYIHVTCAHDRENVEKVFNDVQHIIVNKSLAKSGLL